MKNMRGQLDEPHDPEVPLCQGHCLNHGRCTKDVVILVVAAYGHQGRASDNHGAFLTNSGHNYQVSYHKKTSLTAGRSTDR